MFCGVWFTFGFLTWGSDAAVHLLPTALVAGLVTFPLAAANADERHPPAAGALVVLALAIAAPTLVWALPLFLGLGYEGFLREVLLIGSDYQSLYYTAIPVPDLGSMLLVGGIVAWAAAAWAVSRDLVPPGTIGPVAIVTTGVACLVLWLRALAPEGIPASISLRSESLAFLVAPLANLGATLVLLRACTQTQVLSRHRRLATLTPLAVAMYLHLYPRSDFMHVVVALPLSAVVGAALLEIALGWWERPSANLRWPHALVATLVTVIVLARVAAPLAGVWSSRQQDETLVGSSRVVVSVEPSGADDLVAFAMTVDYVGSHTETGEAVLSFPAMSGLLYAADRPSPIPHDYWFPGRPDRVAEQGMLATLALQPPRYIVTLNTDWTFFHGAPGYFAEARKWARRHYRLAARYGRFDILARNQLPNSEDGTRIDTWQPEGVAEAMLDSRFAARRQAARRWLAGLTPADAVQASLPTDPGQAVLFLRALRDGGDLRAAAWLLSGATHPHRAVRSQAAATAGVLVARAQADRLRWASDVPEADEPAWIQTWYRNAQSAIGSVSPSGSTVAAGTGAGSTAQAVAELLLLRLEDATP